MLASSDLIDVDFSFSSCSISTAGLYHALLNSESPIGMAIANSGYYIVASEDGVLNLELGLYPRQTLLQRDDTFSRRKMVAVYAGADDVININAYTQGSEAARGHITQTPIAVFGFGTHALYTWEGFKGSALERMSKNVHLDYCGMPASHDEQRDALSSFYKRGYNRRSSQAMALALANRMYSCGVAYDEFIMYTLGLEKLAAIFDEWLHKDKSNLVRAAAIEHARWNAFMISDGWTPATEAQLKAYMRQGWSGHQHYVAKLHPFIAAWDNGIANGELHKLVEDIVQKHYPEKSVADPVTSDKQTVQATKRIIFSGKDD